METSVKKYFYICPSESALVWASNCEPAGRAPPFLSVCLEECEIRSLWGREQTIWEILEFCYRNRILGLIYQIRTDAHGILVFTCLNLTDAEAN